MSALMEADVTAVAGLKGKHNPNRVAVRHGTERGSVTLGGRRVPVQRPPMRAADGSGELPVPAYELFSSTEVLGRFIPARAACGKGKISRSVREQRQVAVNQTGRPDSRDATRGRGGMPPLTVEAARLG